MPYHIESPINPAIIHHLILKGEKFALIATDKKDLNKIEELIETFSNYFDKEYQPVIFYPDNILEGEHLFNMEVFIEETSLIKSLDQKDIIPIVATDRVFRKTVPTEQIIIEKFKIGDSIDIDNFEKKLIQAGYKKEIPVEERGSFDIRGEIIDIFIPLYQNPVRVELFGDQIESIRFFDPISQLTIHPIESFKFIKLFPFDLNEKNIEKFQNFLKNQYDNDLITFDKMGELIDSIKNGVLNYEIFQYYPIFINNPISIFEILKNRDFTIYSYDKNSVYKKFEEFEKNPNFDLYTVTPELSSIFDISPIILDKNKKVLKPELDQSFRVIIQEQKTVQRFVDNIKDNLYKNIEVTIFHQNDKSKKRVQALLKKYSVEKKLINFVKGVLKTPFKADGEIFLSDIAIFGQYLEKGRVNLVNKKNIITSFSDLNIGDYVVHNDYGIGIYKGMVLKNIGGVEIDFLEIHYDKGDKLFVPVYNLHTLYKHSSSDSSVKLDSFKNKNWQNKKQRIKKSIKKIATELIHLYSQRMLTKGFKYTSPSELYDAFCNEFPYLLTKDQAQTIIEILNDMERETPMDRLVCGDVGFGKTEVAMRAAFKAVEDNKQVALLAPTTVLAYQHYNSFIERFKSFPIDIDYVSSFKTSKQKKESYEKLKNHQLDILIGTHALLSKSAEFKDLGLLIIDEEQRFGVKDKERLRELKTSIDTLTLTATPIPRTLNFSLTGIRDLSIITTPPKDRKAVKTIVSKKRESIIKKAIKHELDRDGQIFYIHNRVKTIYKEADYIYSMFPNIKMAVAHAQMSKQKLEKIMFDFYRGKFDLLLSTNIVESGIDIPNANTIIIDKADHFGLSSLYQLRGRVGRSLRQGFCYLIVPKKGKLGAIAERRISVISRYTDLGSGFQIAMRDLEIRGAGSLLGFAQKGHVEDIGYEAYMNFLKEAIDELKGGKKVQNREVDLHTSFSAFIPEKYISDQYTRLSFYKTLSSIDSEDEINKIGSQMVDRFGKMPQKVENLFNLIKIKKIAMRYSISKINVNQEFIYFKIDSPEIIDISRFLQYVSKNSYISITHKNEVTIDKSNKDLNDGLNQIVKLLENVRKFDLDDTSESKN